MRPISSINRDVIVHQSDDLVVTLVTNQNNYLKTIDIIKHKYLQVHRHTFERKPDKKNFEKKLKYLQSAQFIANIFMSTYLFCYSILAHQLHLFRSV